MKQGQQLPPVQQHPRGQQQYGNHEMWPDISGFLDEQQFQVIFKNIF